MRRWRDAAAAQRSLSTAVFWADKVLSLTGLASDAFALAQVLFDSGEFIRVETLLRSRSMHRFSLWSRHLAALAMIRANSMAEAQTLLGDADVPVTQRLSGKSGAIQDECLELDARLDRANSGGPKVCALLAVA
nr:anaphase promoting complex subunit cdc16 [Polyrhizophydium stewartii]